MYTRLGSQVDGPSYGGLLRCRNVLKSALCIPARILPKRHQNTLPALLVTSPSLNVFRDGLAIVDLKAAFVFSVFFGCNNTQLLEGCSVRTEDTMFT